MHFILTIFSSSYKFISYIFFMLLKTLVNVSFSECHSFRDGYPVIFVTPPLMLVI